MRFLTIFLNLVCRVNLILHNLIEISVLKYLAHMLDHSKTLNIYFWMTKWAKNDIFGHFLEFCLSDQLDIAYSDKKRQCFQVMKGHSKVTIRMRFWPFYWVSYIWLNFCNIQTRCVCSSTFAQLKDVRTIRQVMKLRTSATARYNSQLQLSSKTQNVCVSVC